MSEPEFPDWERRLSVLRHLILEQEHSLEPAPRDLTPSTSFLQEVCRRAGQGLPAAVSDWLQPDAAQSLLTEKIDGFRPERGDFRNWCIAVVKNDAISRLRQMNKDALGHARTGKAGDESSEEESWMGDHDPSGESLELMTEQLDRIRSHLDRCHSQQQGRIDYHAVLLVHLRWFLSERLRKAFDPWEHAGLGNRSELVEYCLPWRAAESERRFQPGWPMIQQIWQAMAEEAREHARPLSFEKYQQILESLCPEAGRLTPDLWYHWTKRARDRAREQIGTPAWDSSLGLWFTDRNAGGGQAK